MLYHNLNEYQQAVNRIVPVPKKTEELTGKAFVLDGNATVTAPTAEFGPVMTAGKRVKALFPATGEKKITLSMEKAPFEARCAHEGYTITVTENAIDIVGYGERGLLYGVITLEQLANNAEAIPALKITDWPDNPIRGFKEESRFGSDQMEREDWLALIEDIALRKLNTFAISLYGCWGVQYDGRCSEYLFLPLKNHPELSTPKRVKYYSPTRGEWVEREDLPPIFRDNFLEDIFRTCRDWGIEVVPLWNSFGHNTLIPRLIPEIASVDENGVGQKFGFCTSKQETYDFLFSAFDQIIDDYMIPYGMTSFNIGLDEVSGGINKDPEDVFRRCDPWCKCPDCRDQEKGDIFINFAVKLIAHLKEKGMKSVFLACDMLDPKRAGGKKLGDITEKLMKAVKAADVADTLVISWWAYHDIPEKMQVRNLYPERGLRNIVSPWNGYQMWCVALQPLGNIQLIGATNHRDGGEGMVAYSIWDKSQDRVHDALADYSWGYEDAGTPNDVTKRYALRHFPGAAKEAYRGYRLMDYAVEQRNSAKWSFPDAECVSMLDLLFYRLNHYIYAYPKADAPYPRVFMDEALEWALTMRQDLERALYNGSAVAREAMNIFLSLAEKPGCDRFQALRQAYECHNYLTLMEDWLAIFEMHDLCAAGDNTAVAAIARSRAVERIALMQHCEDTKERFVAEAMTMRQHSIFLQLYLDIADWCEKNPGEKLDFLNMRHKYEFEILELSLFTKILLLFSDFSSIIAKKKRKGKYSMKKIICLLLASVLLLGLCACGGGGASAGGKNYKGLQVGFGRTSIVPDVVGVEIAGGDASARLSTGYRDEVSATCIAIKEGDQTILLYTIDFIVVDKHVYAAQPEIAEATGIPEENIILNTTHTHSGVSIRSNWDNNGHDAYRAKYRAAAVEAAQIAIADLSPAEMYYGSTMTENMVFVRHYLLENGTTYGNGHGTTSGTSIKEHLYPSDGELQVIKFARAAEDKKDVVLMNLGAHATMMNAIDANMISADWPYNARSYVEYELDEEGMPDLEKPKDYLCAVFEAAAGDQIPNSNIKSIAPYGNKYPEFGNKIGEYCMSVLDGEMTKAPGTGINVKVHNYTAPSMKEGLDDAELLAKAQEVAAVSSAKGSSHPDTKAAVAKHGFPSVYEATGLVGRLKYPDTYSMELHAMTIDGVSFIFAPFEMFGVTGREIKDTSPYDMTFVVTCSENKDGYHMGYLPHEYACEESFYEYDVTKFARGTAEDLAKTYVQMLTEMKGAE